MALDRASLRKLLESQRDFDVVADAENGPQAARLCGTLRPDVVITVTSAACGPTGSSIPEILRASPRTHVLAIAPRSAAACVALNPPRRRAESAGGAVPRGGAFDCLQLALAQGALGLLRRDAKPQEFFRAVRAVGSGRASYDGSTAATVLRLVNGNGGNGTSNGLSSRDREVADLIADGCSNKEIAQALAIGVPTVKKHVSRLLAMLGLQDRLQLGLRLARDPLLLASAPDPRSRD